MDKLSLQRTPARMIHSDAFGKATIDTVQFILEDDIFALENRLARFVGAPFCVTVSDAASGIALALRAAGIGSGDLVLCAALGCAIPVQGITLAGARPAFVDINPNTFTVDAFCLDYVIAKLRRQGERPRALIAVDLFGTPCHYRELDRICREREIVLIEDLSEAFAANVSGIMTGNFGRFSVASFAGSDRAELGGGAVFCRCEDDAFRLASLRESAKQEFMGERGASVPCMSSADAHLVAERLDLYPAETARRREIAGIYREKLRGTGRFQQMTPGAESAFTQLVLALSPSQNRQKIIARLGQQNIPLAGPGRGHQTGYCDWNRRMLPCALSMVDRLLCLPLHPHLGEHLVDDICETLLQSLD